MKILGLHHITLVSGNIRRTFDFYRRILGLRLVKKTVNFDDPSSYHLYFGDEEGSPGTIVTFFEWADIPRGLPGIGGTHHLALQTSDYESLLKWKRRLQDEGVRVHGPMDRGYFQSIYFTDPDGMHLEIATQGKGYTIDEAVETLGENTIVKDHFEDARISGDAWEERVPVISGDMSLRCGMHHISAICADIERTDRFYREVLGMQRVKKTVNHDDPTSAHWFWGVDGGRPGTVVTYFERSPDNTRFVQHGTGQTHHFALAVEDEQEQLEWRRRIMDAGIGVSEVKDRTYFKSIYTQDPDGHIIELATNGPGFMVDESKAKLGNQLMLPKWLEPQRSAIEEDLTSLDTLGKED